MYKLDLEKAVDCLSAPAPSIQYHLGAVTEWVLCTFYVYVVNGGTGSLCDVKAPDTVSGGD